MLFEKSFKNRKIYSNHNIVGLLLVSISVLTAIFMLEISLAFLLFIFLSSWGAVIAVLVVQIIALIILVFLAKMHLFSFYIRKLLKRRAYIMPLKFGGKTQIKASAVFAESDAERFNRALVIKQGNSWQAYDLVFDIYSRTQNGEYKSKEGYYTVFEAKLNRITPHVLLDSITAKEQQFEHLYMKSQRMSLGAGFDEHFEVYAPKYYTMDTLSFITPEIMVNLIELKDCDIELVQGSLLCYTSLLTEEQLEPFIGQCLHLRKALNSNLSSYKDSWTNKSSGVTDFGKQLAKKSGSVSLGGILVFGIYLAVIIIESPSGIILLTAKFWLVGFIVAGFIFFYIRGVLEKRKQGDQFRQEVLGINNSKTGIKNQS